MFTQNSRLNLADSLNDRIACVAFKKDGTFVQIFDSISHAARTLNLDITAISGCLLGRGSSVHEYIFIPKDKYTEGMIITYNSILRKRKFKRKKS